MWWALIFGSATSIITTLVAIRRKNLTFVIMAVLSLLFTIISLSLLFPVVLQYVGFVMVIVMAVASVLTLGYSFSVYFESIKGK